MKRFSLLCLALITGVTAFLLLGCPPPSNPQDPSYSYTVTFYRNDGTDAVTAVETVEYPATAVSVLPVAPSREGYIFAGWNTAAGGRGLPFTVETPVTTNIAVYAQWGTYSYKVTFNNNGGNTAANPAVKTVASPAATIDALPAPPAKTGYVFAGWNTAADGTGAAFDAAILVTADITVYAQWVLPYTYIVTFNSNGGDTEANPPSKIVDAPATTVGVLPTPPTRAGQILTGWNTAADGTGTAFTAATPVTADITVYAQWKIPYSYTVSFDANGGDTAADPAAILVNEPDTTVGALPTPPTKAGHILTGWNTAADGTGTAFDAAATVTGNLTVYAQWKVPYTYTVTFNSNNGTTEASPASKTVIEPATTVGALPTAPAKTGYVFAGWNTAADGTGAVFGAATTVTGNLTVYARWVEPYDYTVTFNANGGDTAANPPSKIVSAPATTIGALPAPPAKTGHFFTGWNTKADGTGAVFGAGTPVTGDITVYAQWRAPYAYTVGFNSNGGTTEASPASKTVNEPATTIDALPTAPAKTGHFFTGWNTAADGSGAVFDASSPVTADITVYAQWGAPYSYTVSFNSNNGTTEASPASKTVNEPATTIDALPTAPAKTGYIFNGWHTDVNGLYGVPFNASTPVTADITVYAQWLSYSYTVTFDKNTGDTEADPSTRQVVSPAISLGMLPVAPEKNGYRFIGWNTEPDGSGVVFDAATPVTADITVYARWADDTRTDQDILLNFSDPGTGAFSQDSFTLIQGSASAVEPGLSAIQDITLSSGWDASPAPEWRVDGRSQGTGGSITLDAANYTLGGHTLQVSAYQGGVPWSKTVSFKVIAAVSGVSLNKTSLSLAPGQSETLSAQISPANAAHPELTWSVVSSTPAGAVTVTNGLVSAISAGTAVIRAVSVDNSTAFDECTVTVGAPQGITLQFSDPGAGAWDSAVVGDTFTLIQGGASALEPGLLPSRTITLSGVWDSQEWRVDGRSQGTGTGITLNAGDYTVGGHTLQVNAYQGGVPYSKTLSFKVIAAVSSLSLNKTSLSLSPGGSETLLARIAPANAAHPGVTWSVAPTGVVTVSNTGLVSAQAMGTAVITATSQDNPGASASCTVTVGAPQAIALRFLDPGTGAWDSAAVGDTFTLSKGGNGSKTITLTGTWANNPAPAWRVDGLPAGGGTSTVLINAVNYTLGGHTLQVTVYDQGGIPWSKTISFTVTN